MGDLDAPRPRAAVITVSDRAATGERDDRSGPAVTQALERAGFDVVRRAVVADAVEEVRSAIAEAARSADLVATTGGTGLSPRDVTPEATRAVMEREAPGIAEAMRAAGAASTPTAWLSRGVAGVVNGALVVNLPGSPSGAAESVEAIADILPHAVEVLRGGSVHPEDRPSSSPGNARVVATAVRVVEGAPPCRPGQKLVLGAAGPIEGTLGCAEFDAAAERAAAGVMATAEPSMRTYRHDLGSVEVLLERAVAPSPLFVLGATPVAAARLRGARDLGYRPVLVEPRRERVMAAHRTAAVAVLDSLDAADVGPDADVVHTDHEASGLADEIEIALRRGARFVGVMGSARHVGRHLDELRARGLAGSELDRLQTPVGLDIGAVSPEEIALSILAGLVAARNGRSGGWLAGRPA
ncbi:MAG TPA: molybdenum cofactor synthesis domain-containing protein [Actinomycetota bacterium]|nr:molybdenum cofactor synthesis domain-containing protein [Actinomycetota bacterium]